MKYYVIYTEACTPTIKSFDTKVHQDKWVQQFLLEHQTNPDNFIDLIFQGEIFFTDYQIEDNE